MARSTWLGSTEPAVHADPLEAQTPSRSRLARRGRLSVPSTEKASVLGSRSSGHPWRSTPGSEVASRASRSVHSLRRTAGNTGSGTIHSKALTRPAIAARFSVPPRRSFSWAPPCCVGCGSRGERMNSAPAPLGPWNLCAQTETRSASNWSMSRKGSLPKAWTASVWKGTPRSRQRRPMAATGWTVPVSLFAVMTETSAVSGRSASATEPGSTRPTRSTGRSVRAKPSWASRYLSAWSTAWCSTGEATRWRRPRLPPSRAVPRIARLLDSVPPPVKTTSLGRHLQSPAMR